jgi:hypothetical protein
VGLNTIEEKMTFYFIPNVRVVHVDLEAITGLLGLNTFTHTHKTYLGFLGNFGGSLPIQ